MVLPAFRIVPLHTEMLLHVHAYNNLVNNQHNNYLHSTTLFAISHFSKHVTPFPPTAARRSLQAVSVLYSDRRTPIAIESGCVSPFALIYYHCHLVRAQGELY